MSNTEKIEQLAAILMVGLIVGGAVSILFPFLPALILAVILAIATHPVFRWLARRLGDREVMAASLLTLAFFCLLVVPVIIGGVALVDFIPRLVERVHRAIAEGPPAPPSWLGNLPLVGERLLARWQEVFVDANSFLKEMRPHILKLTSWMLSAGGHAGQVLLQGLISVFVLFFLYRDGTALAARLRRVTERLGGARGLHLLDVAEGTMRSVVYGLLGAAVAQGFLATIGLWLAGVPGAVFLGTLCIILAMIPVGLIMVVLLPACGWLFYTGQTGWGVFLLVWSVGVVGQVDNFIRPVLISRGANTPIAVVLLGVLGGLATSGVLGIFIGATVLAVCYALLKEWSDGQGPVYPAADHGDQRR